MEVLSIFGQGCIGKFLKILDKTSYSNYPRSYVTELSMTSVPRCLPIKRPATTLRFCFSCSFNTIYKLLTK